MKIRFNKEMFCFFYLSFHKKAEIWLFKFQKQNQIFLIFLLNLWALFSQKEMQKNKNKN